MFIGQKRGFEVSETESLEPVKKKQRIAKSSGINILNLPDEMLCAIFSHLNFPSFNNLSTTCSRFRFIVKDVKCRLFFPRLIESRNNLLSGYHTQLTDLNLESEVKRETWINDKDKIDTTLKMLSIIEEFFKSISNSKEDQRTFAISKKELELAKSDLLVLAEKTQVVLGILFDLDKIKMNVNYRLKNADTSVPTVSFSRACKLKFPMPLIELFMANIDFLQPIGSISENIVNCVITHPERTRIFSLLGNNKEYIFDPINSDYGNTINHLITHSQQPSDLRELVYYIATTTPCNSKEGAEPVLVTKDRKIKTTKKLLLEKNNEEFIMEFLYGTSKLIYETELWKKSWEKLWMDLRQTLSETSKEQLDSTFQRCGKLNPAFNQGVFIKKI